MWHSFNLFMIWSWLKNPDLIRSRLNVIIVFKLTLNLIWLRRNLIWSDGNRQDFVDSVWLLHPVAVAIAIDSTWLHSNMVNIITLTTAACINEKRQSAPGDSINITNETAFIYSAQQFAIARPIPELKNQNAKPKPKPTQNRVGCIRIRTPEIAIAIPNLISNTHSQLSNTTNNYTIIINNTS